MKSVITCAFSISFSIPYTFQNLTINPFNDLVREKLGWDYEMTLEEGMKKTYEWVRWQVSKQIYAEV